MRIRFVVLSLAFGAAGCTFASDCKLTIPEAQRADAMRFAIDRGLVGQDYVPRDDLTLALGAGRPYGALSEEERNDLARHAAGYAACIRERVNKARQ